MGPAAGGSPDKDILKDSTGDIAKLRRLGITDSALMTFLVRVRDGQPRDQAMKALLNGRSLSREDKDLVRAVLDRLPIW